MAATLDTLPSTNGTDQRRRLGERLRSIRRQQGMSLADVEQASGGEWKAVVVGAYERGDRAITIERLHRLAAFYRVPLADLLPSGSAASDRGADVMPIVLDITALEDTGPRNEVVLAVRRFAARIQRIRGDHNGRILTLRSSDLHVLGLAFGLEANDVRAELEDHGVLLV